MAPLATQKENTNRQIQGIREDERIPYTTDDMASHADFKYHLERACWQKLITLQQIVK